MKHLAIGGIALAATVATLLVGCSSAAPTPTMKPLTLTIGALVPQTGQFSSLAPAETAGITLAMNDINQASLGITVKVLSKDSGDAVAGVAGAPPTATVATASVKSLIAGHATAIVGASSNDVSRAVIGQVTGAGLVMISPQNSAAEFSSLNDHGLYFRTSPSDDAEGSALGSVMAVGGGKRLALMVLDDDYGTGVEKTISAAFTKAGGQVVAKEEFPANQTDFSKEIAAVVKSKPDAVALVTQGQATTIVPALVAAGIPATSLYFTDRDLLQYGPAMPVALTGATGIAAGPVLDSFFEKKVLAIDPTLTSFSYAPESYDAVVLLALAALDARSTDGARIAAKLRAVSGGSGHGEKATDFASAAQIILAGDAVDYDGYSGGIAFDANGDPTKAVFGIFHYGADNRFTRTRSVTG
ncbi:MAG: Amino acid transporter substrate-binding protein [Microbacteriaceae bacterium]|nr:Amino acid transporter substrate-binding protein [Microbacteriaceae bacterium]